MMRRFLFFALLFFLIAQRASAQRYGQGAIGVGASIYKFYFFKPGYRGGTSQTFSGEIFFNGKRYGRRTVEGIYSTKHLSKPGVYRSEIKEFIASYAWGHPILNTPNHFFVLFFDFGPLAGYTDVVTKNKDESAVSPFKNGFNIGAFVQLNAEVSLTDFFILFARLRFSYNGPFIYDKWPFYQAFGVKIVFN